jgi:hypothetical protein
MVTLVISALEDLLTASFSMAYIICSSEREAKELGQEFQLLRMEAEESGRITERD